MIHPPQTSEPTPFQDTALVGLLTLLMIPLSILWVVLVLPIMLPCWCIGWVVEALDRKV